MGFEGRGLAPFLKLYICHWLEWYYTRNRDRLWVHEIDPLYFNRPFSPLVHWRCWLGYLACQNCLWNYLLCVRCDVKPYLLTYLLAYLLTYLGCCRISSYFIFQFL